jgi:hypothetical protein
MLLYLTIRPALLKPAAVRADVILREPALKSIREFRCFWPLRPLRTKDNLIHGATLEPCGGTKKDNDKSGWLRCSSPPPKPVYATSMFLVFAPSQSTKDYRHGATLEPTAGTKMVVG